jgi:hypothetical protein
MTLPMTSFARVELRLLRQVADGRALGEPRLAGELLVEPAMIRSSVDLPEPFGPSTPILASG